MTCGMSHVSGKGSPQMMVDQTPRYDNAMRRRGRRPNQVMSRKGIIRPDKRKKAKYF